MALNRVWLNTRNIHLEWYLLLLLVWKTKWQIALHGRMCAKLTFCYCVGCCVGWFVSLWLNKFFHWYDRKDLLPCAYARVTGGPTVFACNVAIFLCEIVSCTSYGATLWDSVVGYGVFPRRFYSDCTDQFLFCQQNNYFLDVNSLSHYY